MSIERHGLVRAALFSSLALFWLNFLLTTRWAHVPGALHGSRRPLFAAALIAATVLALLTRRTGAIGLGLTARLGAVVGLGAIVALFLVWFPPAVWQQIPLPDNWPARFQSTAEGLALLGRGTLVGWQWGYLGGYPLSTDLTVTLTIPALLPMVVFGDRVGFHLAHLCLFLLPPLLVWWDLRQEAVPGSGRRIDAPASLPSLALALTSVSTLAYSYPFLRSGDTNSLAGVVATLVALVGSHASARGRSWGPLALVGGLTLIVYSHAGFLLYAGVLLTAEALFYRDRRRAGRSVVAFLAALVAGLPLTWESWRYPEYFTFNNVVLAWDPSIDWLAVLRQVYYNVEILAQPGRWVNDYTGLTMVTLPLAAVVLFDRETRAGFYAAAVLAVVLLTRLHAGEFGYAFIRPVHLMAVLTPAVVAAFVLRHAGGRLLGVSLCALVATYLQVLAAPVPHTPGVAAYQPELVERLRNLDGALVLVENTFHRDMIEGPGVSDPTPFESHFHSLLAPETGKRLYAGIWDGWQWSPYRGQLVAAGAWMGRAIETVPRERFLEELDRWGIRHLLVIHDRTRRYLAGPDFVERPQAGPYRHFERVAADTRSVVTPRGTGALREWHPLGATIALDGVIRGDRIVVRTNYHPAWTATHEGAPVPLVDDGRQLAFDAPADGTYLVTLSYPTRSWLWLVALAAGVAGVAAVRRLC